MVSQLIRLLVSVKSVFILYQIENSVYGKRSHIFSGLALFTEFRNFLTYDDSSTFGVMKSCLNISLVVASHDTEFQKDKNCNICLIFYILIVKNTCTR